MSDEQIQAHSDSESAFPQSATACALYLALDIAAVEKLSEKPEEYQKKMKALYEECLSIYRGKAAFLKF